jgi:N-dimethylarginine dimethylaminohydrolase
VTAVRVTHEWGRLREVVVGRPYLRLPDRWRAERKEISEALRAKLQRARGRTMEEAMPSAFAACRAQMDGVVALLRARGVRVHRVPAFRPGEDRGGPDGSSHLLFPRDPLLAVGGRLLALTVRDPRRRREQRPLRRLLRRILGARADRVRAMDPADPPDRSDEGSAFLDGGDCLIAGATVYVGVAPESSTEAGAAWLRRVLGRTRRVEVVPFATELPHLDCVLSLVKPGLGIFCPEGLPQGPPRSLRGWRWIEVSRGEAERMAANGLQLDAATILVPEGVERVADSLRARGHGVLTAPFDAITPFGGGLRCWSQPIRRWG